jgi:hypothetical protein
MTRFILILCFLIGSSQLYAQHIYPIRADSVRIYSNCDTAELILENRTKDTLGFLFNKGKGRTEFRKLRLINVGSSGIAIEGQDTIQVGSSANLQTVTDKDSVTTHAIAANGFIVSNDHLFMNDGTPVNLLSTSNFNYAPAYSPILSTGQQGTLGGYLDIKAPLGTYGAGLLRIWDAGEISLLSDLTIDRGQNGAYNGPRIRGYLRDDGDLEYLTPLYLGKDEPVYICNTSSINNPVPANVGIGYFNGLLPEARLHIKGDLRLDDSNGILIKALGNEMTTNNPSDLRIRANLNSSVITSSGRIFGAVSNLILQSPSYVSTPNGAGNVGIKTDAPTSTLDVTGTFSLNSVTTTTTSMTLADSYVVLVNNTAAVNITLPLASTCKGRMYVVKKANSNTVAISVIRSGTDTIDGATAATIATAYGTQTFISSGTAWFAIGH